MHPCEKFRRRRIPAPVVPHLQHVGAQRIAGRLRHNFLFGILFGVAGKQDGALAVHEPQYQRVVVFRWPRRLFSSGVRPEHVSVHSIPIERRATRLMHNRNVPLRRQLLKSRECRRGDLTSNPQAANSEILDNSNQPTEMVVMGMGQRHNIQPPNPPRPKIRRHGVFARVRSRVVFLSTKSCKGPSSIDQHRLSARKNDQDRISLADVQCRHFQRANREPRCKRITCNHTRSQGQAHECHARGLSLAESQQHCERHQRGEKPRNRPPRWPWNPVTPSRKMCEPDNNAHEQMRQPGKRNA